MTAGLPRKKPSTTTAADLLYTQGFGTRRECRALVAAGRLSFPGPTPLADPEAPIALVDDLCFDVDGTRWPYRERAVVLLHKPAGYECSQRPGNWPSVMTLLPPPLRNRGVQPVGRLDQDTTGALLLTDDGALLHRWTSPRHHVHKVYQVTTADTVTDEQLAQLRDGVLLHGERDAARALSATATHEHGIELVLDEGRYHQVKRMVAAVGNRVTALHRSRFGDVELPADLPPGAWRWV